MLPVYRGHVFQVELEAAIAAASAATAAATDDNQLVTRASLPYEGDVTGHGPEERIADLQAELDDVKEQVCEF